jgi:hypothetical protein
MEIIVKMNNKVVTTNKMIAGMKTPIRMELLDDQPT